MKMYNLGHMDQDIRSPDVKDYKCARCITCSTSSLSINFNIFSKKKKKEVCLALHKICTKDTS